MVQLLVSAGADIDSQDNRKVSCLMAAFRKGHVKVVKWMVRHVTQFPSDTELQRFIASVTDKVREDFQGWLAKKNYGTWELGWVHAASNTICSADVCLHKGIN